MILKNILKPNLTDKEKNVIYEMRYIRKELYMEKDKLKNREAKDKIFLLDNQEYLFKYIYPLIAKIFKTHPEKIIKPFLFKRKIYFYIDYADWNEKASVITIRLLKNKGITHAEMLEIAESIKKMNGAEFIYILYGDDVSYLIYYLMGFDEEYAEQEHKKIKEKFEKKGVKKDV